MALVPAKCTQCGASIEVDPSQEAGICKSCGTAFITEKVIKNYNTFNVDKSVNIYLGGKGDSKKEERDDEIRGLFVSLDYTDRVDTYKRVVEILKKYPGSADAHTAAAIAIGELMTRDLEGSYVDDITDYEMYLDEVDGKDVYINISYPLGLLDKAKKLAKNEKERQTAIKAEQEFYQNVVCKLYEYYIRSNRLGPNRPKILEEAPISVEKILSRINPPEDKPAEVVETKPEPQKTKKERFNIFRCLFANDVYGWGGFISIMAIIAFAVCMILPGTREWLLARWFLFGIIVIFVILGIYIAFLAIRTESELVWSFNNKEYIDSLGIGETFKNNIGDHFTREKLIAFGVILTKDNYWYALIPYVDDTVMTYHIIRRLAEDLKNKTLKTEDIDWLYVHAQVFKALEIADEKKLYTEEEMLAHIKKETAKYKLK